MKGSTEHENYITLKATNLHPLENFHLSSHTTIKAPHVGPFSDYLTNTLTIFYTKKLFWRKEIKYPKIIDKSETPVNLNPITQALIKKLSF